MPNTDTECSQLDIDILQTLKTLQFDGCKILSEPPNEKEYPSTINCPLGVPFPLLRACVWDISNPPKFIDDLIKMRLEYITNRQWASRTSSPQPIPLGRFKRPIDYCVINSEIVHCFHPDVVESRITLEYRIEIAYPTKKGCTNHADVRMQENVQTIHDERPIYFPMNEGIPHSSESYVCKILEKREVQDVRYTDLHLVPGPGQFEEYCIHTSYYRGYSITARGMEILDDNKNETHTLGKSKPKNKGRPKKKNIAMRNKRIVEIHKSDKNLPHRTIAKQVSSQFSGDPCSAETVRKVIAKDQKLTIENKS